ncbi:UNVERIFIED_CONTAM: hypothetical protein Sradi_5700000 [Sesamum radiatum]|uniref:SWIM-type domain-containing protein n=1 Tax=Sesamum radiatum TaxID=300843 RepID=A0AAW2L149_SESRA
MCLISDRNSGLMGAIEDIPDFVPPRGAHRLCLRHVCSNFNSRFKNAQLKDLCWRGGSEYQIRKFDRIMDEIRGLKPEARYYLDKIDKEKWTASHDGAWRCGILTTNMSECINGVLKGARRLPVTAIVDMTFHRSVSHFDQRMTKSSVMLNNNQLWTDYAYKLFKRWFEHSVNHTVTRFNQFEQTALVVTRRYHGQGGITQVVNIATRECSCGKWSQFGIPCSNAQKVCAAYKLNATSMVKQYYDLMPYRMTYSMPFIPLKDEDYWDVPEFQLVHDKTIRKSTRPNR